MGISALATPAALAAVERLYAALYAAILPEFGVLTLLRFILAFAVLLIPTTLMGATLSIVVKSSLLQTERLGERVSLLYATNTAGAIADVLLAGLYLVGGLDINTSFHLAAALNLLVGVVEIAASLALGPVPASRVIRHASPVSRPPLRSRRVLFPPTVRGNRCRPLRTMLRIRPVPCSPTASGESFCSSAASARCGSTGPPSTGGCAIRRRARRWPRSESAASTRCSPSPGPGRGRSGSTPAPARS
ncbi:MAG: hypothetical protein HY331_02220 [Chloroflexi bacterium]|nr:hypothetical protein [Chloroflexota bacterium]